MKNMVVFVFFAFFVSSAFAQSIVIKEKDTPFDSIFDARSKLSGKQFPVLGDSVITGEKATPVNAISEYVVCIEYPVVLSSEMKDEVGNFYDGNFLGPRKRTLSFVSVQYIVQKENGKEDVNLLTLPAEKVRILEKDGFIKLSFNIPSNYFAAYVNMRAEFSPVSEDPLIPKESWIITDTIQNTEVRQPLSSGISSQETKKGFGGLR